MVGLTATWLDGTPVTALPLPDRGLDYGDGVFETLLLRRGRPLFLALHLERLQRGLATLRFPPCLDAIERHLRQACAEVTGFDWPWAALRVTVSRGGGPRGYVPPDPARPRTLLTATALDRDPLQLPAPAVLQLASVRCASQPALAGIKHLNRLEQVLAAMEASQAGVDEALMLDQAGDLVSVTSGNIFLVSDGNLLTPPLATCGITGTRRRLILQRLAPACGLAVRETALGLAHLDRCDEAFYSNSLLGLRPIGRFGSRAWSSHPVCEALFHQYCGELQ